MKLKIILNPDRDHILLIKKKLKENDGYCPCSLFRDKDTKCMCREFREQKEPGPCHCHLYEKIEVEETKGI